MKHVLILEINKAKTVITATTTVPTYALFLKTLLPAGGASATFFPAALTPTFRAFFFWAAAVVAFCALPPFFTTVVAFEVVETVLWLLTVRDSGIGGGSIPRFGRVVAVLVAGAAFRPVAAFPRIALGFSASTSTSWVVAAMAADLAGEIGFANVNCFEGLIGFRGETGRERWDFWGEPSVGRMGDWGRVRELDDLGESTVDGFVTWREGALAAVFGLFFGFGRLCAGSGVFSLSSFSMCSLARY